MLEYNDEVSYARSFRDHNDIEAAHKIIASHLRLVVKIARNYRSYGLPIMDLIGEGNIGIMHALKKFDPEKGFRFATYAVWWIKASIHEFIIASWSLVKIGTTALQKRLFFKLKKYKAQIKNMNRNLPDFEQNQIIAEKLGVKVEEINDIQNRLLGDRSLEDKASASSPITLEQTLSEEIENRHDVRYDNQQIKQQQLTLVNQAIQCLNPREKDIFKSRKLNQPKINLEQLANKYAISKERVRQIEEKAMQKIKHIVSKNLIN